LCCDQRDRLTIDQIKAHPFFRGVEWDKLREIKNVPIKPQLKDQYDTRYFDTFEEESDDDDEFLHNSNNPKMHWPAFTFKSPQLRRLTLGTWGRNMTLRSMFTPPTQQELQHNQQVAGVDDGNNNNNSTTTTTHPKQ